MRASIPSVAYTDPEVAWVGTDRDRGQGQNISIEKGAFPWAASGRSLSLGRDEGFTKLLFDPARIGCWAAASLAPMPAS
jgi:dihydrolipoamide dehydrogenase